MWTVIFAAEFIACAIAGVSLSDAKFTGDEYLNESSKVIY